jgi:hypothetical protein
MDDNVDREARRRARSRLLLGIAFGTLVAAFIGLMMFIDYYAESLESGLPKVHDAAEP